jgi:hypothetical protein
MRVAAYRPSLGHKEGSEEKGVRRDLHNSRFAILIRARNLQAGSFQLFLVCRIQSEVAVVGFH